MHSKHPQKSAPTPKNRYEPPDCACPHTNRNDRALEACQSQAAAETPAAILPNNSLAKAHTASPLLSLSCFCKVSHVRLLDRLPSAGLAFFCKLGRWHCEDQHVPHSCRFLLVVDQCLQADMPIRDPQRIVRLQAKTFGMLCQEVWPCFGLHEVVEVRQNDALLQQGGHREDTGKPAACVWHHEAAAYKHWEGTSAASIAALPRCGQPWDRMGILQIQTSSKAKLAEHLTQSMVGP